MIIDDVFYLKNKSWFMFIVVYEFILLIVIKHGGDLINIFMIMDFLSLLKVGI